MAAVLATPTGPVVAERITPPTIRFAVDGKPCPYWSDGHHVVVNEVCRCGRQFWLFALKED